MSLIASSSRQTRSRQPLISLPLTTFIQPAFFSSTIPCLPSPKSLSSHKRGPSTLLEPSSPGNSKTRKVSRTEQDGTETIRKTRVTRSTSRTIAKGKQRQQDEDTEMTSDGEGQLEIGVTPRIKNILSRDDLGTGKSPARKLFVGMSNKETESPISGISGAIPTPPKYHRGLAPSPPISDFSAALTSTSASTSSSNSPVQRQTTIDIDVQNTPHPEFALSSDYQIDCGFTIYQSTLDELRALDESVANNILGVESGSGDIISRSSSPSPSLSEIDIHIDNRENIQPLTFTSLAYLPSPKSKSTSVSRSNKSTPTKYSDVDDEIVSMYLSVPQYSPSTSGSSTRRRERSKLVNEVLLLRGEKMVETKMDIDEQEQEGDDEVEELTPGRKVVQGGRERLAREVNMI
ncbi:uncharacterized protein L201_000364 [Kwoniella dendrophila CBS 6074]|uniref:Uncharacterized protein n=1 Tax=Kwoniella dendrophila CBS 6074 TaxID=1295534 RepID=A0AAX4JLS1_9TREE